MEKVNFMEKRNLAKTLLTSICCFWGGTAQADFFTFNFSGAFDNAGPSWPGAATFDVSITVDNGGTSPIDTFNVNDLEVINLISGAYDLVWDASAGGINLGSSPDFWTITYDGAVATWTMADFSGFGFETINLQGATDNQGGAATVGFIGFWDGFDDDHVTFVTTSITNSNNFNAVFNGTPNVFTGQLIPEPTTLALLALGGVAMMRRRRAA